MMKTLLCGYESAMVHVYVPLRFHRLSIVHGSSDFLVKTEHRKDERAASLYGLCLKYKST